MSVNIFIQNNVFENVVCKMATILFRIECGDQLWIVGIDCVNYKNEQAEKDAHCMHPIKTNFINSNSTEVSVI